MNAIAPIVSCRFDCLRVVPLEIAVSLTQRTAYSYMSNRSQKLRYLWTDNSRFVRLYGGLMYTCFGTTFVKDENIVVLHLDMIGTF